VNTHLRRSGTIPAFAFPAEAGTHLPTPEGWKTELSLEWWCTMRYTGHVQFLMVDYNGHLVARLLKD